jgi:hypothetical protein
MAAVYSPEEAEIPAFSTRHLFATINVGPCRNSVLVAPISAGFFTITTTEKTGGRDVSG